MLAFHSSYNSISSYSNSGAFAPKNGTLKSDPSLNSNPVPAPKTKAAPPEADTTQLRKQQLSSNFGPKTTGVSAYQEVQGSSAPNPYAQTILNFVSLQLQRDVAAGATPEELQSRLDAGYKGFTQGYQEAFDQLEASGLLSDEVRSAIADTQAKVLEGINQLAAQLGVKSPIPVAEETKPQTAPPAQTPAPLETISPVVVAPLVEPPQLQLRSLQQRLVDQLQPAKLDDKTLANRLESSTLSQGQARDFSFVLKTQDGDEVTINASSRSAQVAKVGGYAGYGISVTQQQSNSFDLTVEGELDEGELAAINDLLEKVGGISSTFFNGNLEDAFDQAVNLGFNSEEISGFALNLVRVDVQKMQNAYSETEADVVDNKPINAAAERWQALGEFLTQLQEMTRNLQQQGFSPDLIADVAESYSAQAYGDHPQQPGFSDFIKRVA